MSSSQACYPGTTGEKHTTQLSDVSRFEADVKKHLLVAIMREWKIDLRNR